MTEYDKALLEFLLPMVNENRLCLIERVLAMRSRYMTVVLEDIFQSHNASAVLRTCDCFGIQDVHAIENRNTFELNPEVELGAAQWLTVHKYNNSPENTRNAIQSLQSNGYRIVATTPHTNDVQLEDFDITNGKIALLLGTEMKGLSETALELADSYLKIPMMGFTESFNISVSAAIILHYLNYKLRKSDVHYELFPEEKEQIRLQWVKNSVKNIHVIEKAFLKRFGS